MSTPRFSQVCARISAELMAIECERWLARAEDPQARRVLAEHFRMALIEAKDVEGDSASPPRTIARDQIHRLTPAQLHEGLRPISRGDSPDQAAR